MSTSPQEQPDAPRPHVEIDRDPTPETAADPADEATEHLPGHLDLPIEDPEADSVDQLRDVPLDDDDR